MSESNKLDRLVWWAFLVSSVAILLIISHLFSSIDDEKVFMDNYCEQVNLWESDAGAGIEPHNRAGWPNYKEVDCDQ